MDYRDVVKEFYELQVLVASFVRMVDAALKNDKLDEEQRGWLKDVKAMVENIEEC